MGFMKEKYDLAYFLGKDSNGRKLHYGALGAKEWESGGVFEDIKLSLDQVDYKKTDKILEIGFGRAESARYLLCNKEISYYIGIDFSEAAFSLAQKTLESIDSAKYELHLDDALSFMKRLNYKDIFNVVIMLDTIEHIPSSEVNMLLPYIYHSLVPDGYFIVHTPFYSIDEDYIKQNYTYISPSSSDLIIETKGMHCNKFTKKRFITEIEQAGFKNLTDKLFLKHKDSNNPSSKDYIVKKLNSLSFSVKKHWLWERTEIKDYEPHTYKIFKKYLHPEKVYIDIGAWVGPTILFATEIGIKHIYAIEANPLTFRLLQDTCNANENLRQNTTLFNVCVTDKHDSTTTFGGKPGVEASSVSSIRGKDWTIQTVTIVRWLEDNNIKDFNFIKIDIEGAESLIYNDLITLSNQEDLIIYLSLHPPFWENPEKVTKTLIDAIKKFDIYGVDDVILPENVLISRLLSDQKYPKWGTQHGNFFEVILKTRNNTMNFEFISFFTEGTNYEIEARELKKSLSKFGFSTEHIVPRKNLGDWHRNCCQKPVFIKEKLLELNKPVVWIDSDAELIKFPSLFNDLDKSDIDISIHYLNGKELYSATIYLKPTPNTFNVLDKWIEVLTPDLENKGRWKGFEQSALQYVIATGKYALKIYPLPLSYACIFDLPNRPDPVIVQNQASRKYGNTLSLPIAVERLPTIPAHLKNELAVVQKIISVILPIYTPSSVLDIGCYDNALWLKTLYAYGCKKLYALCTEDKKPSLPQNVKIFVANIQTQYIKFEATFDMSLCLFASEHIDAVKAPNFVSMISKSADSILFCCPVSETTNQLSLVAWAKLFNQSGFQCFDIIRPAIWNDKSIPLKYRKNTVLFVKENTTKIDIAKIKLHEKPLLDVIHPEEHIATLNENQHLSCITKKYQTHLRSVYKTILEDDK